MGTISGLLLQQPTFAPFDLGRTLEQATNIQGGQVQNQTRLMQLADLKRKQEAEAQARQYFAQHPEEAIGQGGGSILGSLQTAPGGSGGGPISPQVTPPGGPQSIIASRGPQPQTAPQDRLMQLMRTNPDAAFQVMAHQQQVQTQRLDIGAKVAGGIARIVQGVTDQPSLEQAREQVAMIDPRAAAQLPQFYSKEALEPFIKRAFTVQESADLRLKTWHQQTEERKNQLEEMKIGVQLQNAGYQGLGTDVTSILRGLTDEQIKQFGGRTTAPAVAYATEQARKVAGMTDTVKTELGIMKVNPVNATADDLAQAQKNIQDRELGKAGAAERQRGATERELRGEKTVSEVMGTKATNIFDTQTGETGNIARMKIKDYEAMPEGRVKELSPRLTEQMENINNAVPIVAQLQEHIDKIYGPGGVLARMSSDERVMLTNAPGQWAKQYAQKYPELQQAQRFIDANKSALSRALAGEKGAMSEGDVDRAGALLPNLETALKVWPPTEIGWRQPDTRGVALRSMNSIVDMINSRGRSLLGNEKYAHPKLHRYETAEDAQTAAGGTVTAPPVEPPPPQGRQPGEIPVLGGPGMPEQYLPAPGKQSQAQPARRGIELARASGAKVMDMRDVDQAMAETGKSRAEVLAAAKSKGYVVYGSAMA